MRRLSIFVVGITIIFSDQFVYAGAAGTTAAAFLKRGTGARTLSLGEATTSITRGPDALSSNPALISDPDGVSLQLNYQPVFQESQDSQATLAIPFKKFGMAFGFHGISHSKIDATDDVGNKIGDFNAGDQVLSAGVSSSWSRFNFGLAGKIVHQSIADKSASTWAADLGSSFENPWFPFLSHALVLRNLGGKIKFVDESASLPQMMIFGNGIKFHRSLLGTIDLNSIKGRGTHVGAGIEWNPLYEKPMQILLRGGYLTSKNQAEGLSGASFGVGLQLKAISLDYAWIPFGELGDIHVLSFKWNFSKTTWPTAFSSPRLKQTKQTPINEKQSSAPNVIRKIISLKLKNGEVIKGELIEETEKSYWVFSRGKKIQVLKKNILNKELNRTMKKSLGEF